MAFYIDTNNVKKSNYPERFTKIQQIGEKPLFPGIYKCQACGFEDVMNRDCDKFPPCSNCRGKKGTTTWKLLVTAEDK